METYFNACYEIMSLEGCVQVKGIGDRKVKRLEMPILRREGKDKSNGHDKRK